MNKASVLIIDDEPDIRELLAITLGRMNIDVRAAENTAQARRLLGCEHFDLCLTDMNLPDGNGIEVITYIQENYSDLPVAMITAFGSMDTAIDALKAGAFDFVTKPVDLQRLRDLISNALKLKRPEATLSEAPASNEGPHAPVLIGSSPSIVQLKKQIAKLARSQAPIYISGESGTGKEVAARLIHQQGPRRDAPFIPINCGAIPAELVESELFGHTKGSFSGAIADKEGLFQAAHGGTLFFDEIADLPLAMQVKLLRAIQEKSVRPVGGHKEIAVDVRILSATHKNLAQLVADHQFRQDLFYRINVIELNLPPLHKRPDDIPALCDFFLQRLASECQLPTPLIDAQAMDKLCHYRFAGNVRELENILERAFTLCEDDKIYSADLQLQGLSVSQHQGEGPATPCEGGEDLEGYLEGLERVAIEQALDATHGNKTAAARKLGISFRAMRYRLKKLRMD